jgi:hypothetical protein
MSPTCEKERRRRLAEASRRGFADGVASVFTVLGRGPAPVLMRRSLGSLEDDLRTLRLDCQQLIHEDE